jgi:hypothetical protein
MLRIITGKKSLRVQTVAAGLCSSLDPAMPNLKRAHDEDDGEYDNTQKAKKQKNLSTFERCKEHTRQLQEAMTRLDNFLTANSLVDDSARDDMLMLSDICGHILKYEDPSDREPLSQEYADGLSYPLDELADDALDELSSSALKILTNNGRRALLTPLI